MPNCRAIDPLVTPYVDRELPDADRQAVDEHLARVRAVSFARRGGTGRTRSGPRKATRAVPARRPPLLRARCAKIAAEAKVRRGTWHSRAPGDAGTSAPRWPRASRTDG